VGLLEFINTHIKTNEVIEKALRRQVKMFPEIAIRELVANALIHQDFSETGTSVTIEIYDDRVVIGNPGEPFISPDRFIDSYQSRNERLADIMRRLGICEEKGSGVDQVVNSAEMFQLPAPLFEVGERRTNVTLFAHQEFEEMNFSDRVRACFQHCVLRYVSNQKMTNQSLRERFKLPSDRAERVSSIIRDTIDKGYVKLDDPGNTSKRYAKYVPFWA
jgi:ATP-dependent DNA helicase RecG